MTWADTKIFVEQMLGISNDATHVIIGLCAQLILATLLRMPVTRFQPWALVLLAQLGNEAIDLQDDWGDIPLQWGESAKDTLLTLFLPTLILVVARARPGLFSERARQAAAEEAGRL